LASAVSGTCRVRTKQRGLVALDGTGFGQALPEL